jgi:hypothetical protein
MQYSEFHPAPRGEGRVNRFSFCPIENGPFLAWEQPFAKINVQNEKRAWDGFLAPFPPEFSTFFN